MDNHQAPATSGRGSVDRPSLVDAHIEAKPSIGLPALRAYLGQVDYNRALEQLSKAEYAAWMDWLNVRRDKWNRRLSAPALFRSQGPRVIANEHTTAAQQRAAMKIAQKLHIELLGEG